MRLRILWGARLEDGTELVPGTVIDIPARLVTELIQRGDAEKLLDEEPETLALLSEAALLDEGADELAVLETPPTATVRRGRPRGRRRGR
jgi:hypothetical protein